MKKFLTALTLSIALLFGINSGVNNTEVKASNKMTIKTVKKNIKYKFIGWDGQGILWLYTSNNTFNLFRDLHVTAKNNGTLHNGDKIKVTFSRKDLNDQWNDVKFVGPNTLTLKVKGLMSKNVTNLDLVKKLNREGLNNDVFYDEDTPLVYRGSYFVSWMPERSQLRPTSKTYLFHTDDIDYDSMYPTPTIISVFKDNENNELLFAGYQNLKNSGGKINILTKGDEDFKSETFDLDKTSESTILAKMWPYYRAVKID